MFEINNKRDIRVTVRFSECEIELMEKYMYENNIKSKMIIQVHDELVVDALKSEQEQVMKIMDQVMTSAYKLQVPLKVDVEYGINWYDVK